MPPSSLRSSFLAVEVLVGLSPPLGPSIRKSNFDSSLYGDNTSSKFYRPRVKRKSSRKKEQQGGPPTISWTTSWTQDGKYATSWTARFQNISLLGTRCCLGLARRGLNQSTLFNPGGGRLNMLPLATMGYHRLP